MRTLDHMKREKQLKIASETVWVYAPLAHRMGLYNIKTELEDLSMKYMEPEAYKDIARKLAETKRERTRYINEFIRPVKDKLVASGFSISISTAVPRASIPSGIRSKRKAWHSKRCTTFSPSA
jgi:guanosine-3',5'-bis(diphosphate) 3'-pyrophosphohydrolase